MNQRRLPAPKENGMTVAIMYLVDEFVLDVFQNQWFFNFLFRHASVLQAKFLSVTPSNEPTRLPAPKEKGITVVILYFGNEFVLDGFQNQWFF